MAFPSLRARLALLVLVAGVHAADAAGAPQLSTSGLRFFGTGANQQDRVRIQIDDDAPGPDASAPCDVGAGDFTLEFWVRGSVASNPTSHAGGDVLLHGADWREGNIVLDRDVLGGSEREFGVSLAGGYVRFGVGGGDLGIDHAHTLEGDVDVLDGAWHHVACVREQTAGTLAIYVDGALDMLSSGGISTEDLSYPDAGVPGQGSPWGNYLVLCAAKHDLGSNEPSFNGMFDELRVWSVARTAQQITATWQMVVPADTPGLVANHRFEEGSGTALADSSLAASPDGLLIAGVSGNGQWTSAAIDPTTVAPLISTGLPPGFGRTTITTQLADVTALAAAPDGRVFVGELDGDVWVIAYGQVLAQPLIQIPVGLLGGSRGLLGLCVDPDFAQNGWLYVYYATAEPRNRVGRFTVIGDTASLASEFVVWQNVNTTPGDHNGGGLAFGADGKLYVTTGDQFVSSYSPDLSREDGKLLRVNPDGTVPADNPFSAVPSAAPTIFARGLRNPFRLCVDPQNGQMWFGDVGGNGLYSWEELDRVEGGSNYGWPFQEGTACYVTNCAAYTSAVFQYRHDDPEYFVGQPQASIIAGVVYRANVFPPQYRGNVFVADFANRWIRRLLTDAQGSVVAELPFHASPDAGSVVDMEVGADGALYIACHNGQVGPASVYRIAYSSNGNLAPVPVVDAAPLQGNAPLTVQFDGQQSFDPDSAPSSLVFDWSFGDGAHASTAAAQHTYTQRGVYFATLSVDDSLDASVSSPLTIEVGTPPVPQILEPQGGASYAAGDTITLSGAATDVEDGRLPPSALSWRVELIHGSHAHPFVGPIGGVAQTSFLVPTSGHPPEDTFFRVHLTATDFDGLQATATVDLEPDTVIVDVRTWPPGLTVFLDGQAEPTPRLYESLPGYDIVVEAQRWTMIGTKPWLFRRWSDGHPRIHTYTTPALGGDLWALYSPADVYTRVATVTARDRNAQFSAATGQQFVSAGETDALWVGKVSGQKVELGLEFALAVPRNATVLAAFVEFVAGSTSAGHAQIPIFAYDVANAPKFVHQSTTSISSWAASTAATTMWDTGFYVAGQTYQTPDVSALIQEVVDRADWSGGQFVGLVFNGTTTVGNSVRSIRNFDSGTPAKLVVTYGVPRERSPFPATKK